jgi:alanine dehydrogenase
LVLLLTENDVRRLLTMDSTVKMVEQVFRYQAEGKVILPPRLNVQVPGLTGSLRIMPSAVPDLSAVGHKTISGAPGFRDPLGTYFTILLFDNKDGKLVSIVAGETITQMRTGAASGVATRYLSREDSSVLGLLGVGFQGKGQALGVHSVRKLEAIRVFGPVEKQAALFAQELSESLQVDVKAMGSPEKVVAESDILATATPAKAPIFDGSLIKPGTHINAIGSNTPDKCELDGEAFARSRIVVDHKEQALLEAGDLLKAIRDKKTEAAGLSEIGDIIIGKAKGRESPEEITIFKSVGVASEDIAVASAVYKAALDQGSGTEIRLK